MSDEHDPPAGPKPPRRPAKADPRGEALRANLRRRKQAARKRRGAKPAPDTDH